MTNTGISQFSVDVPPKRRRRPIALDGRVSVGIVIGGAFQSVAHHTQAVGCDILLVVDVSAELEAAQPQRGAIRVVLAAGHTIKTLTAMGCSEALKKFLDSRPAVDLSVGLGQMRAIGKLAVQALLADPTFDRFIKTEIFERLLILSNGHLEQVDLIAFASGAGGTGGPVAPVLVHAIASVLLARSDAIVHERFVRVGSLTFVSLGDRVHSNAAATLAEDLHYILAMPRHPREVRSLILTELPMVQGDKAARDTYATQLVQALRARAVCEVLDYTSPNRALDTGLGTVRIINVAYFQALNVRRIAEDVSLAYVPRLEALRDTPDRPSRLQDIQPAPVFASSSARDVEDLIADVRSSKGVRPENFADQCTTPTEVFTGGTVNVSLNQSERFQLGPDIPAAFRRYASTQAEWKDKLETMQTVLGGLAKEIENRESQAFTLDQKFLNAVRELERVLDLFFPQGLFKSIKAFMANPRKKLVALQNAIQRCRELSRQRLLRDSELMLLQRARASLQDSLDKQLGRLETILNLLSQFLRPGIENEPRCTETVPLDDVLPDLFTLAEQKVNSEDVLRTLEACVQGVSVAGLAEITGATHCLIEDIARCLISPDVAMPTPLWGGRLSFSRGTILTVLPLVTNNIVDAIRTHVQEIDGETLIVASDTVQAGANVLRLEIQEPRDLSEVVTRFYGPALEDARKTSEQHAGKDDTCIQWLHDRLNGTVLSS